MYFCQLMVKGTDCLYLVELKKIPTKD